METRFFWVFFLVLFLLPAGSAGEGIPNGQSFKASPRYVTEGEFAVQLANAFGLGETDNPEVAQALLVSAGVEPWKGWISDRKMTRVLVAQIERSVSAAVDSRLLLMGKKEALEMVEEIAARFRLPVTS